MSMFTARGRQWGIGSQRRVLSMVQRRWSSTTPAAESTPAGAITKQIAMERWGASRASLVASISTALPTLSLSPMHLLRGRTPAQDDDSAASNASGTHGGILWERHERMDYYLEWELPKGWVVAPRVSENFIMIQCAPPPLAGGALPRVAAASSASTSQHGSMSPPAAPAPATSPLSVPPRPPTSAPSVHGFSITSFAYHHKVASADDTTLLKSFLAQFSRSVGHSVQVVASSYHQDSVANRVNTAASQRCHDVATSAGGAVCEISFRPPKCPDHVTRGLCRAFFHHGKRFHCVATFAVPEDEYLAVSADWVVYGITKVAEAGGDSNRI